MRARKVFLSCLLACVGIFGRDVAAQQNKAVEDEVIRITKAQWAAEMQKNSSDAMSHIASDYTEFNSDYATRLDGKDINARLTEAGFKDSGKIIAADMINPRVQVYGNVAVFSYNYVGVVQDKDGTNTPTRAKSTRIYVKQGNDWMLVHANFGYDPVPGNR